MRRGGGRVARLRPISDLDQARARAHALAMWRDERCGGTSDVEGLAFWRDERREAGPRRPAVWGEWEARPEGSGDARAPLSAGCRLSEPAGSCRRVARLEQVVCPLPGLCRARAPGAGGAGVGADSRGRGPGPRPLLRHAPGGPPPPPPLGAMLMRMGRPGPGGTARRVCDGSVGRLPARERHERGTRAARGWRSVPLAGSSRRTRRRRRGWV